MDFGIPIFSDCDVLYDHHGKYEKGIYSVCMLCRHHQSNQTFPSVGAACCGAGPSVTVVFA